MKQAIVVGGGISGLSAAFLLQQRAKAQGLDLSIRLLEKDQRIGGKIWSIKEEGYLCEWGPNGFLDSKPQTLDLCKRLGADRLLLRSNDNARKRFIYSGGMLHQLPENGPAFLKSKLISWPGKLRLAMEPFAAKPPMDVDETLADFGRRRLGKEALQKLIAPMVSGIFAGNPETMSLVSCFPRIAELELEYGSLIMAMIKLAKKKKADQKAGKVVASAAGPGGILTSFREGIQALTDALATRLEPGTILSGQEVVRISRGGTVPYRVTTATDEFEADAVVLAAPAFAAADMVKELDPYISHVCADIPYSSMTVVCFGYDRRKIKHDLAGFGYLIPKEEERSTLGTLWDSSIFANRAPQGKVLLRSMMGGACFPNYIKFSDGEVISRVKADLATIMGIKEDPSFIRIFRHEKAIPQYTVGHNHRLTMIDDKLKDLPGLFVSGNAFHGIGINDCVASAGRAAEAAFRHLQKS